MEWKRAESAKTSPIRVAMMALLLESKVMRLPRTRRYQLDEGSPKTIGSKVAVWEIAERQQGCLWAKFGASDKRENAGNTAKSQTHQRSRRSTAATRIVTTAVNCLCLARNDANCGRDCETLLRRLEGRRVGTLCAQPAVDEPHHARHIVGRAV
jgi:hypothetical protein